MFIISNPIPSVRCSDLFQVISMNVVLPNGDFVTASASQNSDLFWALRGGGGGEISRIDGVITLN